MAAFKPRSVRLHPDVEAAYDALGRAAAAGRTPEASVWKSLQVAIARVKREGLWGEVIPLGKAPAVLRRKYGIANLYCVDLAHFHRAFHTIEGREVIFLDLVDHATYDKWFGIRRK